MIENAELGVKIAENELEAFWAQIIEKSEQELKNLKNALIFQKFILKGAKRELIKSKEKKQ